jgi:hypothetical protein
MSVHVYVGPSIAPADRDHWKSLSQLELHPPVRRGDLGALTGCAGIRVLIIDGEFGQSLAVAVTEIRALRQRGAWVGGASSMGALRAVECAPLGVRPFGWVAEAFATEAIDSDAEVALIYDPETYLPLTIPLVNVRWMLQELVSAGRLNDDEAAWALDSAAHIHYRDRSRSALNYTWNLELPDAPFRAVALSQVAALTHGKWDRKRLDALGALAETLALSAGTLTASD